MHLKLGTHLYRADNKMKVGEMRSGKKLLAMLSCINSIIICLKIYEVKEELSFCKQLSSFRGLMKLLLVSVLPYLEFLLGALVGTPSFSSRLKSCCPNSAYFKWTLTAGDRSQLQGEAEVMYFHFFLQVAPSGVLHGLEVGGCLSDFLSRDGICHATTAVLCKKLQ